MFRFQLHYYFSFVPMKLYCMKSITALLGENLETGAIMFYAKHKHTNADLGSLNGHSRPA